MDFDGKKELHNPWEKANPISLFLFTWILPLFKKGYSQELNINDLYDAPEVHKSDYGAEKLQIAWDEVKAKSKVKNSRPRFFIALFNVHRTPILIYLVTIAFDELFIRVMQPIYLRKLVHSFSEDSTASSQDQILYAAIVCLSSLIHDLMVHQCVFLMFRTGLSCRTAISSLIYRKAMRLKSSSSEDSSVGYLMNLLSNDLSRFDYQLVFLTYIVIGPIQLIILLYLLYTEMGVSALAGAAFIMIILPSQVLNGRLAAKFRQSVATQTDERSRIMNEIVIAIRVIKMYAWEKPFSSIVSRIRKVEVRELGKRAYLRGFFLSLYTFSTRLASFFVILTYVLMGNSITADKAFFSVAISLTIVETMVFYFSSAVSGLGESIVSTNRIEKFLMLDEQQTNPDIISSLKSPGPGSVTVDNVSASWTRNEKPTLRNMTISVKGDQLVVICGPVGAGKTSLLHLLISEISVTQGTVKSTGRISYASQEPWIFPGDIRQNIIFGEPFDQQRYEEVVTACALKDDFVQLPNGDMSIVGERGLTLSGGQKARVNLARSLYRNADIYIMDDPLSAVDSRVSRHIFEQCLKTYLKGKLRILVTHQLQYLPQADHIILLSNGSINKQGTYEEMSESGVDFVSIMSSENNNNASEVQRKMSAFKVAETDNKPLEDYEKPEDNSEQMVEGSVNLRTYWGYISSANSSWRLILALFLFICGQFLLTSCEYWLSYWTDSEEIHNAELNKNSSMESNTSTMSSLEVIVILDRNEYLGQDVYLRVYSGLVVALFAFTLAKAVGFFSYCVRISNNLYRRMFNALVRAPTKFFDDNPSGRIMNRFTKDMGSIDELLPAAFFDTIEYTLQMIGVVVVIVLSNYFLIIPTVFIVVIFWILRIIFVRTSRDIKRLESIWKSPMFTHVAASLQGLTTIRALGAQNSLIVQFDRKQDIHTAAWFSFISTTRCFAVWAETTGILFLAIVTFSFLLFAEETTGGIVGLVITSTLALSVNIQWAIRQSAETENYMTSVERAIEYTKLEPEAPLESSPDKKPPPDWPTGGEIRFRNMSLCYENKKVLKNLTFYIHPKEKIGIVGRTGAGKSSIISALFRLTESQGDIIVDGVKISDIGLHDLRTNISIIPQDPVLFSGSIRYNLDPFDQFPDSELWEVLQEVRLKDSVSALEYKVSDGGSNFSVGQRQLVCLARAILRRNKIIVLDEATANVDPRTDEFIQKTIRKKFSDCSIITIAHRLHSVMDCDRVLVLEAGQIMEYDHPYTLLQKPEGFFSKLASHTGKSGSEKLRQLAKDHFDKLNSNI